MKLTGKEVGLLNRTIEQWEEDEVIDTSTAKKLRETYDTDDDVKTLTFYAFFAAISCALLAFIALVLDEKWLERLRQYFAFSTLTIVLLFAVISVLLTIYLRRRKKKYVNAVWANETTAILLGLSTCVSVTYFGKGLSLNTSAYYWLLLAASIALGAEAVLLKSRVLWVGMLIAFVGWFTTFSMADETSFFLGMNMPLRLFVMSLFLLLSYYLLKRWKGFSAFESLHYYLVWLIVFTTAWGCSIYGNYSLTEWFKFKQEKIIFWAIGFTFFLVSLLLYALKSGDKRLRDLTLIFLIIDIYTRFFEYFWDRTNKGIFFIFLALSFWLIGKQLDRWRKKQEEKRRILE